MQNLKIKNNIFHLLQKALLSWGFFLFCGINKNLEFNPITGKTLESEFKEWNTSNGVFKQALKDRREKEWEIYSNGNY